jgi:hypothetical protein
MESLHQTMVWVTAAPQSLQTGWAWPYGRGGNYRDSSSALAGSRFVPQGEFYSVAYSNLVVDRAEVVSDHVFRPIPAAQFLL